MRNIAVLVLVCLMLVGIRAQTQAPADKWSDSNVSGPGLTRKWRA
jgi:hypothetical protein